MKTLRAGLLVVLGCLALAAPAAAAPVSCNQVIVSSITVSNDLSECPGNGLVVGAPNITIDLAYHTIDGVGNGWGISNSAGHDNVVVRRGTIKQFDFGVVVMGQSGGRYELLTSSGNDNEGFWTNGLSSAVLSRNIAVGNGADGIELNNGANVLVDRGEYSDNGFAGINTFGAVNVRVKDARAAGNPIAGVAIQDGSTGAVVEWVDAVGNGDPSSSNCQCGIAVRNASNVQLRDNDANENRWLGIWAFGSTPGLQVLDNNASHNGIDGIRISGSGNPLLADNDINDNGQFGINVASAATNGGNNDASGNGGPTECNPASFCD